MDSRPASLHLGWPLARPIVALFHRRQGLVQVTQSLAVLFPISPSGIGTEQALLLYIFRGVTSRTSALSFSVGMRVTLIIVNATLGLGAVLLMVRTLRFRAVVDAERADAATTKGRAP